MKYTASATKVIEVLRNSRPSGEDYFRIGIALIGILDLAPYSFIAAALYENDVWVTSLREQHQRQMAASKNVFELPVGGGFAIGAFLRDVEVLALAEGRDTAGERHVASALSRGNGELFKQYGINTPRLLERVTESEMQESARGEKLERGPAAESIGTSQRRVNLNELFASLTDLLRTRSVVEQHGPTSPEGQHWLANVAALLHQIDAAEAVAFEQRAETIQVRLSSQTAGPIWNQMVLALRRVIARLKLATSGSFGDRDDLTGLGTRGAFDRDLQDEVSEARSAGFPLALIFCDLDDFKRINDEIGHSAGDAVLRAIASEIGKLVQARGHAYRYGGEEMVAILPNAGGAEAVAVAERLRQTIEGLRVDPVPRQLTVSVGVAVFPDNATDAAALVAQADEAMYRAKQGGKNQVKQAGDRT